MARATTACSDPDCRNRKPCPKHERKPWQGSKRRDHLAKRSGSREQTLRRFVLNRDRFICHVCGKVRLEDQLVVDHVIPLSESGEDDVYNRAPCCIEPCHRIKTQREARRGRA